MKIFVSVKAGAGENKIEQIDTTHYAVSVTAPPVRSQANVAVLKLLAEHLNLPQSLFTIKRGEHSRQKTIEILTNKKLL
ncbi:MAG: DUF167 domain-containing protein [Candidatus Berkelbacteria bacterium]|nr:DUF167 domain-containing protein [Candidatus Berkelbacteria bacterium]